MTRSIPLALLVAAVYVLHQDFWNWNRIEPWVLGFLPIGLAYHVGYSLLAAVTMILLVRYAWPGHLEAEDSVPAQKTGGKAP